jgi:hypothetical protein
VSGGFLDSLPLVAAGATRSLSAENPTGAKGAGGMAVEGWGASRSGGLGRGWKVSPAIALPARSRVTIADVEGPGTIRHLWCTLQPSHWRGVVLRCHWDGDEAPAVEVPIGDFFCNGWGEHCDVASVPVTVAPSGGFNSYWPMPFRRRALVTVENATDEDVPAFFYQLTCSLEEVPAGAAYLHCRWRRTERVPPRQPHVVVDGVAGRGHYVGTYLAWGASRDAWWGEGELKFFLDGDDEWPTICGTGTEDYFGGAWGFERPGGGYGLYSSPFLGFVQALGPAGRSRARFGLYRWHLPDPIRFERDLRVTVQALGFALEDGEPRYVPVEDDVASTAFWYQQEAPG